MDFPYFWLFFDENLELPRFSSFSFICISS